MTESEAFKKIAYFCAYRERSIKETREKLNSFELEDAKVDFLLDKLKEERYLDEKRFAESYVGGKFRVKQWGKIKIKMGLKAHGISNASIGEALATISEHDYANTLTELFSYKLRELKSVDSAANKQKMYNFLCSKGFEPEIVLLLIHKWAKEWPRSYFFNAF